MVKKKKIWIFRCFWNSKITYFCKYSQQTFIVFRLRDFSITFPEHIGKLRKNSVKFWNVIEITIIAVRIVIFIARYQKCTHAFRQKRRKSPARNTTKIASRSRRTLKLPKTNVKTFFVFVLLTKIFTLAFIYFTRVHVGRYVHVFAHA